MESFEQVVRGRLAAMERPQAWLARRINRSPMTVSRYLRGTMPWPPAIKAQVAELLDVKEDQPS